MRASLGFYIHRYDLLLNGWYDLHKIGLDIESNDYKKRIDFRSIPPALCSFCRSGMVQYMRLSSIKNGWHEGNVETIKNDLNGFLAGRLKYIAREKTIKNNFVKSFKNINW